MKDYVIVIGGVSIDIKGIADSESKTSDSHTGKVFITPGGVGRNTAENLSRLGTKVYLLGAVGEDFFGNIILEETGKSKVNTEYVIKSSSVNTSRYICVSNKSGNYYYAVIDMLDSVKAVNLDYLKKHRDLIGNSSMIAADTNLSIEVLNEIVSIANEKNIPVLIDGVSFLKAKSINELKGKIDYISLNSDEFRSVFGKYKNTGDILDMLYRGDFEKFSYIILKKGSSGVNLIKVEEELMLSSKALSTEIMELNGAGDAFNAAFIFAIKKGMTKNEAIRVGNCAAYFTLRTFKSVSDELTQENLLEFFHQKMKTREL